MRPALLALTLTLALPTTSWGQIPFLDKMFANVSDVGVFFISGRIDNNHGIRAGEPGSGSGNYGLRGFGIEASFEVTGFSLRKPPAPKATCNAADIAKLLSSSDDTHRRIGRDSRERCDKLTQQMSTSADQCTLKDLNNQMADPDAAKAAAGRARYTECLLIRADTAWVMTTRSRKYDGTGKQIEETRGETVTLSGPKSKEADQDFNVEIAVGFAQIGGFQASDTFDLSGSIQELPSLAAYVTYVPADPLTVYASGRVGLVTLNGWRAQTTDPAASVPPAPPVNRIYSASGTTYLAGYGLGLLLEVEGAGLFAEYTWTRRRFSSVEWSITNSNVIPQYFPRRLNLDTWTWLLGLQVSFK
jgi:hypothetical protein